MTSVDFQDNFWRFGTWFFLFCKNELRPWFPELFAHKFCQILPWNKRCSRREEAQRQNSVLSLNLSLSFMKYLRSVVLDLGAYHLDTEFMSVLSKPLFTYLQSIGDYKILLVFSLLKKCVPHSRMLLEMCWWGHLSAPFLSVLAVRPGTQGGRCLLLSARLFIFFFLSLCFITRYF